MEEDTFFEMKNTTLDENGADIVGGDLSFMNNGGQNFSDILVGGFPFENQTDLLEKLYSSQEIRQLNLSVTLYTIVYSVIFVFGIILNGLAVYRLISAKQFSMLSQFIPLNLAIGDGIMLLFLPFEISRIRMENVWLFGDFFCRAFNMMPHIIMFVSIYLLTLLAFDRYATMMNNSITRVVRGWKQDKKFCLTVTLLAWCAGFCTSLPVIFNSTYVPAQNGTHAVCGVQWRASEETFSGDECMIINGHKISPSAAFCRCGLTGTEEMFRIFTFILTFVIPLISISFFYMSIWRTVFISERNISARSIKSASSSVKHTYKKSLNVLFVTILLVLAYLICWSPYHFTYISIVLGLMKNTSPNLCTRLQNTHQMLLWSNRLINPILYTFFTNDVRKRLRQNFAGFLRRALPKKSKSSMSLLTDAGSTRITCGT